MLRQLTIKNFALIDQITIDFDPHLNVLTGETGAGKSILIDAIRFVLGERVDNPPNRVPEQPAAVEAVFEILNPKLRNHPQMKEFLGNEEDDLILRREWNQGKSRSFINQRAVNASTLKELGRLLMDIHGQYDHQLLLETDQQLDLIDRLGKLENLKERFALIYQEYQTLTDRKQSLLSLEEGREREADLLKYQIEEIGKAELEEGEENEIREEKIRLVNTEKLHQVVASILSHLSDDNDSASSQLGRAAREFSELSKIDPSTASLKSEYESVQLGLEEIIRTLEDYKEKLSFDPERLEEIEERLDAIELVKRKYGSSVEKIREFLEKSKKRYDELVNSVVYLKDIDKEMKTLLPKLKETSDELTEKRRRTGTFLKKVIEDELGDLGISNAKFHCRIEKGEYDATGQDRLEFMISLNAGEPEQELRKIISAGEVSRVMLAMKKALMKVDPVLTLIFDEIDANIGGRLGTVTGRKLKEISAERQVLLITHLPQIASFADRHFKVVKKVIQGKTYTQYQVIDGDTRVKELAQMMSGSRETEASLKHAEEMLSKVK